MTILLLLALFASLLSPSVESRVEAIERAYRGYWREHMALVDPVTGRVDLTFTGGADSVRFPFWACWRLSFPIITHNHPMALLYTPSPEDVETAIRCDAAQIRVAGWNRLTRRAMLCVMQRNPDADYWQWISAADIWKDFNASEGRGKYTYTGLIDAWARYWTRFAAKYGYSFTCQDMGYHL